MIVVMNFVGSDDSDSDDMIIIVAIVIVMIMVVAMTVMGCWSIDSSLSFDSFLLTLI